MKGIWKTIKYPLIFWLGYFLLNTLLFTTDHWIHNDTSSIFPENGLLIRDTSLVSIEPGIFDRDDPRIQEELKELEETSLFWLRNGHDIFKLNVELWIWILLILLLRPWPKISKVIMLVGIPLYVFILVYYVYYTIYTDIYAKHPLIMNDLVMGIEVLPIFLAQITFEKGALYFTLAGLGLIFTFGLVGFLIYFIRKASLKLEPFPAHVGVMGMLGLFILISFSHYYPHPWTKFKDDYLAFQPVIPRISQSLPPKDTGAIVTTLRAIPYEAYQSYELEESPDVYFLVVESYGQILTANPELAEKFYPMVHQFDSSLQAKGWKSATSYSLSPVAGGSSWIAFTSALSGVSLDNHLDFKELISIDFDFPHIVDLFNHFGYETYRLKTFRETKNSTEEAYAIQNNYFKFDQWLKYNDFNYEGFIYNYFGGIPDQYALDYFQENYVDTLQKPHFTFFINLITHGPWFIPPPVTADWRELNAIKSNPDPRAPADGQLGVNYELFLPGRYEDRYLEAIEYEFDILEQFISQKIDENSIVILIGDHQPGHITNYDYYGLESMLHIIAKDDTLIQKFWDAGLKQDMRLYPGDVSMKHAGFFSLFMPIFLERYANNPPSRRPKFYKEGV